MDSCSDSDDDDPSIVIYGGEDQEIKVERPANDQAVVSVDEGLNSSPESRLLSTSNILHDISILKNPKIKLWFFDIFPTHVNNTRAK